MSTEQNWFVAEAVFQATAHTAQGEARLITENLLFLVRAVDHPAAVARAETIARAKEHSYKNEKGETVSWTFDRLVEVTVMIDQRLEDGAELKSVMTDVGSGTRTADDRLSHGSVSRRGDR